MEWYPPTRVSKALDGLGVLKAVLAKIVTNLKILFGQCAFG